MSPGVAFFLMNISFNGSVLSVKIWLCFLTLKQLGNALAPHRAYREEGSIPSEVTNRSYFYFVVVGCYLNGNGGLCTHGLLPFSKTRKNESNIHNKS